MINRRKRIAEIVLSGTALFVLLPIFLAIYITAKIVEGGPVLFHQIRIGQNGNRFYLHKFRTMKILQNEDQNIFDAGNTTRVTAFGRFLRRTKMDEIPQLWNVFCGEMSFVGPRPEVAKWVSVYKDRWVQILLVKPGITDPASIVYRHEEVLLKSKDDPELFYRKVVLPHKLDLYENYIRTRSGIEDIKIIASTIRAMFFPAKQTVTKRKDKY